VSYQTGEMLFCISDIFAKVFLTLILVNATLEESQNQTASRIQSITSEMEQQMEQSEKLLEKLIPPAYELISFYRLIILLNLYLKLNLVSLTNSNPVEPQAPKSSKALPSFSATFQTSQPSHPKTQRRTCSRLSTSSGKSTTRLRNDGVCTRWRRLVMPFWVCRVRRVGFLIMLNEPRISPLVYDYNFLQKIWFLMINCFFFDY
jgi:hypothetical protein